MVCALYIRLNAATIKDVYPLPRIEDALSRLEGARYFSILDMQAGYWQVGLEDKYKEKQLSSPEMDCTNLTLCPLGYRMLQPLFRE